MGASCRRRLIVGNWKMFTCLEDGVALADAICMESSSPDFDLVICPPFTSLALIAQRLANSSVSLGGQNMHWESEGAFTGEVSAKMLLTVGCQYVILGHSERRTYFDETSTTVNRKVKRALVDGLIPIMCVGETLAQREAGAAEAVVREQVYQGLSELTHSQIGSMVIAYEPVWAIGTGHVATPEQANSMHGFIRSLVAEIAGTDLADRLRLLYGGSVKPENAGALMAQDQIDGALVGGASLQATSFMAIARVAY